MKEKKHHRYLPWRDVLGWRCIRCGRCCKEYLVPLTPGEAIRYSLTYGPVVIAYKNKYYLAKKIDGSCCFLTYVGGLAYCLIYYERPLACRLYPFYITKTPIKGIPEEKAIYPISRNRFVYVYIDSSCPGVNTVRNINSLVKEVIRIWQKYRISSIFK